MKTPSIEPYLRPGESPVRVIREYGLTKLPIMVIVVAIYFALFFFFSVFISYGIWGVVAFFASLAIVLLYALRIGVRWYYDVCIFTTDRIIDIHRRGLFSQRVQEIQWQAVVDVQYAQPNVWSMLFSYGTITLTLRNSEDALELQHVFSPKEVHDIVMDHIPVTDIQN